MQMLNVNYCINHYSFNPINWLKEEVNEIGGVFILTVSGFGREKNKTGTTK